MRPWRFVSMGDMFTKKESVMDWNIIGEILTYVGSFLGGGWLMSLYKAKPEKTHLEIDNVREAMGIQKDLIASLDKRIDSLSREITVLNHRVDVKHEVIYSAYGCRLIATPDDCVVIKQYNEKCLSCGLNEAFNSDE